MIPEDFEYLFPVEVGLFYRNLYEGESPKHIIKFEELPKDPAAELAKGAQTAWIYPKASDELLRRMGNSYYTFMRQTRLVCECSPESVKRFTKKPQQYEVIKRIHHGYDFAYIAEWINDTIDGAWSAIVRADPRKRAGKSFLVFSFEDQKGATLFKLFQEEKEEE